MNVTTFRYGIKTVVSCEHRRIIALENLDNTAIDINLHDLRILESHEHFTEPSEKT